MRFFMLIVIFLLLMTLTDLIERYEINMVEYVQQKYEVQAPRIQFSVEL